VSDASIDTAGVGEPFDSALLRSDGSSGTGIIRNSAHSRISREYKRSQQAASCVRHLASHRNSPRAIKIDHRPVRRAKWGELGGTAALTATFLCLPLVTCHSNRRDIAGRLLRPFLESSHPSESTFVFCVWTFDLRTLRRARFFCSSARSRWPFCYQYSCQHSEMLSSSNGDGSFVI
jgi:hypothetical protein